MAVKPSTATPGRATAAPQPKISFVSCPGWPQGSYSYPDADRVPAGGLAVAENVQLTQYGTVGPRPGLSLYGAQPIGTVLGEIFEFVHLNTTTNPNTHETWRISMQVIGGVGVLCVAKDQQAWQQISGKTYSATAPAHFEQVFGMVSITNGYDNISYFDVNAFTITLTQALSVPSMTSAVATGISGSNVTLRYRAAAANQGETPASVAITVGVSEERDLWNGTSQYVTIQGTVPAGAQRINLYVGEIAGDEYFLTSIAVSSGQTTFTFVDTGSVAETTTRLAPVGDSTAGPRTTRVKNIAGIPYMVGDSDDFGKVWFGGTGNDALDFSAYNGGGYVYPNKGGKDFPVVVKPFRDGKGTPIVCVLSQGTNGQGKRYLLSPASTTLGSTVITYMAVQEDNGQVGTDSPDGVVLYNDALWYPSATGFQTTNTKPQIQNILSTASISLNIQDRVQSLTSLTMGSCVGLAYEQIIYWALPFGQTANNQIWMLDLRNNGAWLEPWYIDCQWMMLYHDNSDGLTKFLLLVNNEIYMLDPSMQTNDNGTPFSTNIGTGNLKFAPDGSISGNVIDVTFVFLRPQGNINLSAQFNTPDGLVTYTDVLQASTAQGIPGWGLYGWGEAGWGNYVQGVGTIKEITSTPRVPITIDVGETCDWLSCGVNTVDPGCAYQLEEIIVRYVPVGFIPAD